MKQIIGYFWEVGCGMEYGALKLYAQGYTNDIAKANYVVYLIGNILYLARLIEGEEVIIAVGSNFALQTDKKYNCINS